jgi:hypothetical protein
MTTPAWLFWLTVALALGVWATWWLWAEVVLA